MTSLCLAVYLLNPITHASLYLKPEIATYWLPHKPSGVVQDYYEIDAIEAELDNQDLVVCFGEGEP